MTKNEIICDTLEQLARLSYLLTVEGARFHCHADGNQWVITITGY